MRRLLVAVLAAAFTTSACVDSVSRPITEPDGLRMTHLAGSLSPAMDEVFHKAEDLLNDLYACAGSKQITNKNNDLGKVEKYAVAGWWTAADSPDPENVAYMVDKIISNTNGLIAKTRGDNIPASCSGHYANATERDDLRDEMFFWLNVFKNQGDYTQDETSAVPCQFDEDCEDIGGGWQVNVPANTFNQNVIIIVKPNSGDAPPGLINPKGKSWHFDVLPSNAQANNPWTRYICWAGDHPTDEGDPPDSWIVMVREDGSELDYLPTIVEEWPGATCEAVGGQSQGALVRGLKSFFAGLPFFPTKVDAYSPPRSFGGTSTASSPHWLELIVPVFGCDLDCLKAKTDEYYGDNAQNKNAAMGKLDAAAAATTDEEWNAALASFISVVKAQTQPPANKVLSAEQGAELMGNALALMR